MEFLLTTNGSKPAAAKTRFFGETKMRSVLTIGIAVLLTIAAIGQGMNVAESAKHPGDPIRYTITLEGPVKGTVSTIYMNFLLKTGAREDQKGLLTTFQLSRFKQNSSVEYQVDESVPEVMSGTYQLTQVQLRTKEGAIRNYDYPTDFKQENTVKIDTHEKDIFPNIKSVEPSH